MSKSGGGVNRVCFSCRLKFPSPFTDDSKTYNITSVCCECGGELCSISDSYRVPSRMKVKEWKKLEKELLTKTLITPMCDSNMSLFHTSMYPEHCKVNRSNNVFRGEAKFRAMMAYDEAQKRDPQLLNRVVDLYEQGARNIDILKELVYSNKDLGVRREIRKTVSLSLTYASYKSWITTLRQYADRKSKLTRA
ncbi:hypothetical protein VCHA53O466_50368 [Vibrio chagasii]|nr:hypothetical protein VCHA53O466_50368 [Vibrio chagasii]